jgi:hypothetical protein
VSDRPQARLCRPDTKEIHWLPSLPYSPEEFVKLVRVSHMMNELAVPLLYSEVFLKADQQIIRYFKLPNVVSYSHTRKITMSPSDSNFLDIQQLATGLNDRILKHLRESKPQGDTTDAMLQDDFFRNRITLSLYNASTFLGLSAGIA